MDGDGRHRGPQSLFTAVAKSSGSSSSLTSMPAASARRPYVLLDAGGTLVYPNAEIFRQAGQGCGCEIEIEAIFKAYFRSIHQLDLACRGGARTPDAGGYFASGLVNAGIPAT